MTSKLVVLRSSLPRFYANPAHARKTFPPHNNMVHTPAAGNAPRPWHGLDMNKIHFPSLMRFNDFYPRFELRENPGLPSLNAMNAEEVVSFHDNFLWRKYYTNMDIVKTFLLLYSGPAMFFALLILTVSPGIYFIIREMRLEPLEVIEDDFFDNVLWHTYGQALDHHAFGQYLEARRAKRYRHVDVDPVDYIPAEFRNEEQIATRGPGKPLGKAGYYDHRKA